MKHKKFLTYEAIEKLGYGYLVKELKEGICPECHKPVDTKAFTNIFYVMQFKINGYCQPCMEKEMNRIQEFKNKGLCARCETPLNQNELVTPQQISLYRQWGCCARCQKMIVDKFSGDQGEKEKTEKKNN
jgi:hypothetical protein